MSCMRCLGGEYGFSRGEEGPEKAKKKEIEKRDSLVDARLRDDEEFALGISRDVALNTCRPRLVSLAEHRVA